MSKCLSVFLPAVKQNYATSLQVLARLEDGCTSVGQFSHENTELCVVLYYFINLKLCNCISTFPDCECII